MCLKSDEYIQLRPQRIQTGGDLEMKKLRYLVNTAFLLVFLLGPVFPLPGEQFNKYPYGVPSSTEKQQERDEMERLHKRQDELERRQKQMEWDRRWDQLEKERPGSWRFRPR